jgi:putative oxidoreductase
MMISAKNFNLSDPTVLLRMTCGVFHLPHLIQKLNPFERALGTFANSGLTPPAFWLVLAIIAEAACFIGLTLGVYTKWAALISAAFMLVVVYAILYAKGWVFLWNFGGIEFAVFWLLVSLAVALQAWRQERAADQPLPLSPAAASLGEP